MGYAMYDVHRHGAFRSWIFSNKLSTSTYLMMLLIGYGIGIPFGWEYFKGIEAWNLNFAGYVDTWRVPHWQIYDFRRFFFAWVMRVC